MKRNSWIGVAAVLAVLVAAAIGLWRYGLPAPTPPAPPPRQAAASPPPAPKPVAPSFDAVNVGPDGNAVIAGRAAPGAQVTALAGGQPVGHATADANGEWVITTDRPLPPGPQSLTLSAQEKGKPPVKSSSALALVVPPHGEAQPPVAVLLPQTGTARALSAGARPPRHVALDIVEYDADGRTVLSGRADPGTTVAITIDGRAAATVTADAQGRWSVSLASGVPAGRYHIALSGREADRSDAGSVALDMRRPAPGEAGNYLAVVPGNSLWHLAQHSYGDGLRYLELYRANSAEIEDPNRIFPGQLLALPAQRNP